MNFAELLAPEPCAFQRSRQAEGRGDRSISEAVSHKNWKRRVLVANVDPPDRANRNLIAGGITADRLQLVIEGTPEQRLVQFRTEGPSGTGTELEYTGH